MRIDRIMSSPVLTIRAEQTLEEAAFTMVRRRIGSLVVVDVFGSAIGIITEKDLTARVPQNPFQQHRRPQVAGHALTGNVDLETVYADLKRTKVGRVMRPIRLSLSEDDPVERAMDLMLRHDRFHLPVLRHGHPVGMVARLDLLRLMLTDEHVPVVLSERLPAERDAARRHDAEPVTTRVGR